jgi:predicted DNA-binding ArsR family transcriptional regulator
MNRVKVVNEISELVPILRAVDTEVKKEVLKDLALEWRTSTEIKSKFGKEGEQALKIFEKMNLVETKWQSNESKEPVKTYHTFYTSFHINATCSVYEISDILISAIMSEEKYNKIERKIYRMVGKEGTFVGDIADELSLSPTLLKGLVRRSSRLNYRGHRIERIE